MFLDEAAVGVDNLPEKAVHCIANVAEGLLGYFFHAVMKTLVREASWTVSNAA